MSSPKRPRWKSHGSDSTKAGVGSMIAGHKTLAVEVVDGVLESGARRGDTTDDGGRHGRQGDGRQTDDDEGGEKE